MSSTLIVAEFVEAAEHVVKEEATEATETFISSANGMLLPYAHMALVRDGRGGGRRGRRRNPAVAWRSMRTLMWMNVDVDCF